MVSTIVIGTIGIVAGLVLAFFHQLIVSLIFIILGILTLLSGIPQLVGAIKSFGNEGNNKEAILDLVMSILTVIVGCALIFFHNNTVRLIVGIYLVVFPIIRILVAKKKGYQLKAELPTIVLGIVLVVLVPLAMDVVFKIIGFAVAFISAVYMIFGIVATVKMKKAAQNSVFGTRMFVDVNGDGSVDEVYVDTDGDGKHDSTIWVDSEHENK